MTTRPQILKRALLASAAAGALGIHASALHAQDEFALDPIIVSGNLSPTAASRTGASVELIEGEELEDSPSSLADTLRREPGVSYSANGGIGATTTLRIRGLDTSYIGVRIDGIDVSDPSSTQTSFNLGGYGTGGLSRLEILKGSQSALYGSEAIAGVIDITSWRPTRDGFSGVASAEAGTYSTYAGRLSLGHKSARGEIALTYSKVESDGFSAQSGNTEDDGFKQDMLTFSARHDLTDNLTIGGSYLWRDAEIEIDRGATNPAGINYSTQRGGRIFAEFVTGPVEHTLSYTRYKTERRDPGGFTAFFEGKRDQVSYNARADLGGAVVLNFGLDKTDESFLTVGSGTNTGAYDTTSAMAELQWAATPNLDLSFTARYDDHSKFGDHLSGRIAGVWRATAQTSIRAVLGTGFRTPSLYELYSPYGNAGLKPEESQSAELGVEQSFASGAGVVKATLFYTEIEDLIDFVGGATGCADPNGCYVQIPGTTVSKGLELSASYDINDLYTVYGNYTYTDAKIANTRLERVPAHDLVLGVKGQITPRFGAGLEVQHVADIAPSIYAPPGHKVGDHTLVNVNFDYAVTDMAKAYLRVGNALDEDYETAGGFNTPGRTVTFGVRAEF